MRRKRDIFDFLSIVKSRHMITIGFNESYEQKKLNEWNPLTYLCLLFIIPVAIFVNGWADTKDDIKNLFKWR